MSDQLVERRRRSNSMGVSSKPINNPHRVSPINLSSNPPSINKHVLKMSTGPRLRAATSFSPYQSNNPPSSMAIRRTGISAGGSDGFNTDGTFGKPLAAIAGPLGITIVDVNAPQHPWLVLNYSSTTMAFQPCLSTLQQSMTDAECVNSVSYGNRFSNTQSQSPVLLATARGSGILIWDCSGRSLSPLLGRLNASDSSIGASTVAGNSKTTNSSVGNANGEEPAADPGTINQSQPLPSVKTETNSSDALKSMVGSPKAFERKSSLIRVSSSSSVVAAGATGVPGHALNTSNVTSATATGSLATKTANITSSSKGDVTSLTWKGPSAPILLSTCGTSASAWDLRTSVLSGVGGTGGARPNARFICPEDNLYHADSSLIHCAYSHDELANTFATLDSLGVVRVWDDRKAEQPVHSFLACPGGGVGIASIAPARDEGSGARPRWVSWGIDDEQDYGDDLVAKVWTDLSTNGVDGSNSSDAYRVTSRVSMPGAVAARVHPSCADGIILFRDNPSEKELEAHQMVDGMATTGEMKDVSEGLLRSPNQMVLATGLKMRASPEMVVVQTPPSPPPLMLGEVEMEIEQKQISSSKIHQGWEAELWQIDESGVAIDEGCVGAKKLSVFRGGGDEEDTLSFAPGRGDVSDVIAIDLALGTHNDGDESVNKELSLCVLTKAGRLTVYGVPEASLEGEASEYSPNKRGRVDLQTNMTNSASTQVYRHGADLSPWWNKNEEEHDLFGDTNAAQDSPKKASIEGMRSAADNGLPRMQDSNTKPPIASPSIIPDVNLAVPPMDEMTSEREVDTSAAGDVQQKPIDFSEAARVPCPPLCGVAFSALGKIVSFNNGPVKRMWKYHQSNEPLSSQPRPSFGSLHDDDEDSSTQNQNVARIETVENKVLPRSLGDLIEMTKRAQTLQWGDEQQQNNDSPIDDDGNSTSSSSDDSSTSYDDPDLMVSDSDDSGLASESDGSEGLYHVSSNDSDGMVNVDNMFDDYFASSRKSVLGSEHEGAGQSKDGNFAGLPSLAPSVIITKEYEDIILNGQTPKLANQLKLGDVWWLTKDFVAPDNTSSERPYNSDGQEDNSTFFRNSSDPYLASSSFSEPSLERSSSFSNTTKSKQRLDNSMISKMKLLFANQLPTAMTPPDQRLLNSKSKQRRISSIDKSTSNPEHNPSNLEEESNYVHNLGVYMLENPQTPEAGSEQLSIAHGMCLYNAQVCSDFQQKGKAETWKLLAQAIESVFAAELDETDGWGVSGDALTSGLIEQILQYYEVLGDFQMLSTIVCVLTFGRDRRAVSSNGKGRYQLLPKFDERRYDNYLRQYAALLMGWGALTVRCEVSKRLAYSTPGAGAETLISDTANDSQDRFLANSGVAPGVTFSPLCGRCLEPVTDDNNICPKCKNYAFQCSICCSPVRGACTWCPLCGHGGHLDHMMKWFKQQNVCPTGCGCVCNLQFA